MKVQSVNIDFQRDNETIDGDLLFYKSQPENVGHILNTFLGIEKVRIQLDSIEISGKYLL